MENEGAKMKEIVGEWPSVSVFVAARNEEENIGQCLEALSLQNYPGDWEIRIGDDHSTDRTALISNDYCNRFSNFYSIEITDNQSHVKGKALVLACLAENAISDIFLVCDADMQMPHGWMTAMVVAMKKHKVDLINGTTATDGKAWFSTLQAIDWLIPQGTFAWLSHLGISYTAMGNNMGITRKAYLETGGYFNIPFSLTEDFELFYQAKQNGFKLIHQFDRSVFGISASQKSITDWFEQHIRWMIGFMQLPLSQQWVFYAQLAFYPIWILSWLLGFNMITHIFTGIWILKLVYNSGLLLKIKELHLIPFLPLYEIVWWPAYMWCWIRFHMKKTVVWKGRVWDKK